MRAGIHLRSARVSAGRAFEEPSDLAPHRLCAEEEEGMNCKYKRQRVTPFNQDSTHMGRVDATT